MTLLEKRRLLLHRLLAIHDPQQRLRFIVAQARQAPALPHELKRDEWKVEGCLANLWLHPAFHEGRCTFRTDSDSAIVKGIASLLCELYSGHTPEEILAVDPAFLAEAGISQHLTPNRRNGLARVWEIIRDFARSNQHPASG